MIAHPSKIIETKDGNIVMEAPDTMRSTALANSIYTYILTDSDLDELNQLSDTAERDAFIKRKSLRKGMTMYQLSVLAFVSKAPWHLNDYITDPVLDLKSFLEYADMELIGKMGETMKELGSIDPLSV